MKTYIIPLLLLGFIACRKEEQKKASKKPDKYYHQATIYITQNKPDSAFRYFLKSANYNKDSIAIGNAYAYMSIIQSNEGDYFGSEETATKAISYFKADSSKLTGVFNGIAISKYNLKSYKEAIYWYKKAIKLSKDSLHISLCYNNMAVSFIEQKQYNNAITLLQKLLETNVIINNREKFAQVLDNLAWARWLKNSNDDASDLLKALHIREKEKDFWGQNASYAHLSDFYANKKIDSALIYANKMFKVAKILESPDDQLEALQKLIKLSPSQASKQYFGIYKKLDDSVKTARNAAKNQFALIRYETEKHKADFLKAQTENTQKQNSILKLYLAVAVLISLLILGYLLYRKRKKRLQQEKELEVKNTELKYSKKVHDRVANKIYHVMSVVENTDELNKDDLLDNLEVIYDISRDISYDNQHAYVESNFEQQVSKLLQSYASEKVKISTTGNETQLWQAVNPRVRSEIYCVLQELMTNMKKHSNADEVQINFEERDHQIFISYFDNGKGIKKETPHNNGLTNTGNRIKSINGTINFDTEVEKGAKIQIYFPIS